MNESADGDAMAAANAGGTADGSDGENAGGTNGNDTTDAAEAASASIISEQTLMDNGVSYAAPGASLLWPAAGTILIDYSMDGSVYFPTLNQYKYNPALVIGSDTGNQVLAAAKGIVESTYVDEETGTTLVLNIGNGYKLTYGCLLYTSKHSLSFLSGRNLPFCVVPHVSASIWGRSAVLFPV